MILLNCEICGRSISRKFFNVIVEGAKLKVCDACAKLGEPYEVHQSFPSRLASVQSMSSPLVSKHRPELLPREVEEYDVAEDCAMRIRKARVKLNLSQEELAIRAKEKLSLIQKIESGKIPPSIKLSRILEHILKVKLLVPKVEVSEITKHTGSVSPITLGDIAKIRGKIENQEM